MKPSLNIIVYGKNIFIDINSLVDKEPKLEGLTGYENTMFFTENNLNYTYYLVQREYDENTKDIIYNILEDHFNKKFSIQFFDNSNEKKEKNILLDCLLICVEKLNDDNSKNIFKDIQNYSRLASKQPFVIFLTKKENKPDIEEYFPLITNTCFDFRNIFAFKFPTRDEEKKIIYQKLRYFYDYYNSKPPIDIDAINTLNILIVGQAGAGKSTLQNLLQGEKIAREGEGDSITFRISFYKDKEYNITKIDCPGFENDGTVKEVSNMVKSLRNKMEATKDHIDIVIYLIKATSDRIFYDMERKFIQYLVQCEEMDVIFCANTFGKEEDSDEYYKSKEIIEGCLKSMMREIKSISKERIKKIIDDMVYVNLVKKMKKKNIDVNIYGIDKLLLKCYELLYPKKIDEDELKKAKDLNELIKISGQYDLLKIYRDKGDFRMKNRIHISQYILSCAKTDFWKNKFIFGLFTQNSRMKEMLEYIIKKYERIKDESALNKKVEEKYEKISKKLEGQDLSQIAKKFFNSMEDYKSIFEANGFDFSAYFYNEYPVAIGLSLIEEYEKDANIFDRNSFQLILDLSKGINKGIRGLKKLSEEWKKIIDDIEAGKSDIKWVRRFFKLDKKE